MRASIVLINSLLVLCQAQDGVPDYQMVHRLIVSR
jgi:hypothetical protein